MFFGEPGSPTMDRLPLYEVPALSTAQVGIFVFPSCVRCFFYLFMACGPFYFFVSGIEAFFFVVVVYSI